MLNLLSEYQEVDWIGVTVVDQSTADIKIPKLLDKPAAIRFVIINARSIVGPIHLSQFLGEKTYKCNCCWHNSENDLIFSSRKKDVAVCKICEKRVTIFRGIDLVFTIGEIPSNRPVVWIQILENQCRRNNVPIIEIPSKKL
jgi:hypothetical protein